MLRQDLIRPHDLLVTSNFQHFDAIRTLVLVGRHQNIATLQYVQPTSIIQNPTEFRIAYLPRQPMVLVKHTNRVGGGAFQAQAMTVDPL